MRFSDIKVGKKYIRIMSDQTTNGRKEFGTITYTYMIVAKNEDTEEIEAVVIPEVGKPTAPQWYKKTIWNRWKPKT